VGGTGRLQRVCPPHPPSILMTRLPYSCVYPSHLPSCLCLYHSQAPPPPACACTTPTHLPSCMCLNNSHAPRGSVDVRTWMIQAACLQQPSYIDRFAPPDCQQAAHHVAALVVQEARSIEHHAQTSCDAIRLQIIRCCRNRISFYLEIQEHGVIMGQAQRLTDMHIARNLCNCTICGQAQIRHRSATTYLSSLFPLSEE
jgi:hypothetical protein